MGILRVLANFLPYTLKILTFRYNYPIPHPPVQFDDPPTQKPPSDLYGPPQFHPNITFPPFQDDFPPTVPGYLPPSFYPPAVPPDAGILPPQFDPIPTDDTVVIHPPANPYLPPVPSYGAARHPVQLKIANMSCLDTSSRRFFHATFRMTQQLQLPPVVEDDHQGDCIVGSGDRFAMDLEGNKMTQCGVKYCGGDKANMCVTLRMPAVRGLKLPEDTLVTLQCKLQDTVMVHTKQLRISSINL